MRRIVWMLISFIIQASLQQSNSQEQKVATLGGVPIAFQDPGYCTDNFTVFDGNIVKSNNVGNLLRGNHDYGISDEEMSRFLRYFDFKYTSNTSELGVVKFKNEFFEISANGLELLKNPNDEEYIYIGVGDVEGENNGSPLNPVWFKYLVTFKNSE